MARKLTFAGNVLIMHEAKALEDIKALNPKMRKRKSLKYLISSSELKKYSNFHGKKAIKEWYRYQTFYLVSSKYSF
jgi:hypothetical protein